MAESETRLHRAWRRSGKTLQELRQEAGLSMSIVSLSRKLRGLQTISQDEDEAITSVLGAKSGVVRSKWRGRAA